MPTVTIEEAKTQLSRLIARAEAGEEIVISRDREPVAKLTPFRQAKRKLVFGALAGQFPDIPDAFFFDPLPESEQRAWDGEPENPPR